MMRVCGPRHPSISADVPTATMRSFRMATASALGWLRSTVHTLALVIMVSAAGCACAITWPHIRTKTIRTKTKIVTKKEPARERPAGFRAWSEIGNRHSMFKLTLSPMKFCAQHIEELLPIFFPQQLHAIVGQPAFDAIAALDGNAHLAIDGKKSLFLPDGDRHLNARALFHHQRTMGESVRRDRRDHQHFHAG